jgi:uncharacterized protein (TIGR02300 family)
VAKPELGTKRLCGTCGAKFYDISKDPIVCPKCNTVLALTPVAGRARPETRAVADEETVTPETQEADFVSLEDADAEAEGKKTTDADAAEAGDDDIDLDDSLDDDDAALIEEQEESDDDVTDIIGDRDEDEEP